MRCRALTVLGVLVIALPAAAAARPPEIRVLSNRADLIAGGDALVQIVLPPGTRARVSAGGRDVSNAFAWRPDGRYEGLVTGLRDGAQRLVARLADGSGARITITGHPIGGPVISGPQTQPWVCATQTAGLGAPRDAQCNTATRYAYAYRSTNPLKLGFWTYDPAHPPADVATTVTDEGHRLPFVVRVETGVMDRAIYTVAVLSDPAKPWAPWSPQPGWNGKIDWPFGGDCKPWHKQDTPVDPLGTFYGIPPLDPSVTAATGLQLGLDQPGGSILGNGNAVAALAKGFMVADSALNKLGSSCNSVTSAEAIVMLKEHIREAYGPIRYTIASGSSGGSMQQQQIASAYPGLLDAIQPMASFPDIWEPLQEAQDCHLLDRYFDSVAPLMWALQAQQEAVRGSLVAAGCRLQLDGPNTGTPDVGSYAATWMQPSDALGCGLPAAQVYDPVKNRGGVRCTLQDYMASAFGRRASDGFANRPFDNVGVQYGLRALQSGAITPGQFADLNERIGGLDIDWRHTSARSTADPAALTAAYRGGLVTYGRNLARVPIIDIRGQDNFEIHADFHSYVTRARLDAANGGHAGQIIFTGARPLVGDPTSFTRAFELTDEWLTRIQADHSRRTLAQKVAADRPPAAVDTCWFEGHAVTDRSVCRKAFPYFADPRIAAGGPFTDDVLKCALKPLRRADYAVRFTDAQFAQLQRAFPEGVCDYERPGAGQRPPLDWPTFAAGPGGRALGPAPASQPIGVTAKGA